MAENEQGQGNAAEATNQAAESQGQGASDMEKKIAELTAALESQKSEIAGLNRAVSEREKEKNALKEAAENATREKMSELERLKADFDRDREERKKVERELSIERNAAKAKDFLHENKLPADFIDLLDLSDAERMTNALEKLTGAAGKMKSTFAEEFAKNNGSGAPKTGALSFSEKKTQSAFNADEATAFVKANGLDAWEALPKK